MIKVTVNDYGIEFTTPATVNDTYTVFENSAVITFATHLDRDWSGTLVDSY